ncbi:MAG: hypothetical protein K2H89_00155 [Oscillospiraceae bacterium]|nr:hypothetical protein [Oscillospiraceae bacterium]
MSNHKNPKSNRGAVEVFLTRKFLNSLISVLDSYIAADTTNKYSIYAERLKNKILNHGRKFLHNEEEQVVIYFYENESALLIKLFAIYINVIEKTSEDYFEKIGKTKNNN